MNRADFMNQLESLLQSIAPMEREEAIQYYNDYFDDAGTENEQEVIEALGNPARVAENIKRDLLGNGYGEKPLRKAQASDRALMEYGKEEPEAEQEPARDAQSPAGDRGQDAGMASGQAGTGGAGNHAGQRCADASGGVAGQGGSGTEVPGRDWKSDDGYGRSAQAFTGSEDEYRWSHDTAGWFGEKPEKSGKGRMPVWAVALLVTLLILASPALAGIALSVIGIIFGGLAGWFGMILGFGIAAVCLLLVLVVLVVTGILCCFTNPWVGMAMVGGGLICGCVGLVFLMLTVAMAGIATPAIFRGIGWFFRLFKRKKTGMAGA